MKPGLYELYARLADGRRHNGAALADELGITRAAVWKRMEALRKLGLDITGTAGDGYRLPRAVELLDADRIRSALRSPEVSVTVAGAVDSTNARLAALGSPHATALVAEAQTAGRGRRARGWHSPPGSGLYLSLGRHFECGLSGLAPLSLVVGMSVAECLREQADAPVGVKWPNDLFAGACKLGGCLVEISGAAEGPCRAVAGVGINLYPAPALETLDQAWTSLSRVGSVPSRNRLAAAVIDALATALATFERDGFEAFRARWPALDVLHQRPVTVVHGDGSRFEGKAEGIDGQGRLRVSIDGSTRSLASGEVSVRGH